MNARWRTALARGARRRCPRCGEGPMFVRMARMRERCPACDLRYLENPGDPWAFLLVLDRGAFILPPIGLIYLGWLPDSLPLTVLLFALLAAALIATTPHRYGVCVALDWLVRTRTSGAGDSATGSSTKDAGST